MEKATMSVQELSAHMGISLPKAYELTKREGFPTIRIGTRILVPVDAFKEWYVGYETIDAKLIRPEAVCVMQMK